MIKIETLLEGTCRVCIHGVTILDLESGEAADTSIEGR